MAIFFVEKRCTAKASLIFSTTKKKISVLALVGSVQYTCPVVPLCIVDASLSHYVRN